MDNSEMIKRIEVRLKELGKTKGEFYKGAGISSASYSQWNTGDYSPSKRKLQAVSDYLGVSVEYLMTGEEKAPTQEGERELPHAEYREVLSEGGMRLLMDADAKIPEEHVEEIVEFIKMKQRKYGR